MKAPITIPAGKTESEVITLAHFSLAAVLLEPKEAFRLFFKASFDRRTFGIMQKADGRDLGTALTPGEPKMVIFDCTDFEGPQFFKFCLDKPLKTDLVIESWYKEIRA